MRRVHRAAVVAALGLPLLLTAPGTAMASHHHLNIIYQPVFIVDGPDSDNSFAQSNTVYDDDDA